MGAHPDENTAPTGTVEGSDRALVTSAALVSHVRLSCLALAVAALATIWVASPAAAGTVTFFGTGAEQSFTAPAGATSVRVAATGSGGADLGANSGGRAAVVTATLSVTPGQIFYVEVGGIEGFGGGGEAGGGGASDLRDVSLAPPNEKLSLESRFLVAAGGGGAGESADATGGDAGQAGGAAPASLECAGRPGTALAGGLGGEGGGEPGGPGFGGDGVVGGGGGAGLFGGGSSGFTSGGTPVSCAGGGGGSSKVPAGGTLALAPTPRTPAQVTFSWDDPPPPPAPPDLVAPQPPLSPPDLVVPQLSQLTISPAAFRAKGAVASAAVGGTVRYRLSEPAAVAFSVERVLVGHRRGKRCLAGPGQGQRCPRFRKVRGGVAATGAAGLNRVRFNGRLRGRALPPGRYRLVAIATDAAGNASQPARRPFRILAPPAS